MALTATDETEALEPVTDVMRLITVGFGALVAIGAIGAAFGKASLFGWGESPICVAARNGRVPVIERSDAPTQVFGLRSGASASVQDVLLCGGHSGTAARWLDLFTQLPSSLLLAGFLLLFWRLVRVAQRGGLFTPAFSRGLRTLGWYLLAGTLVASTVEALARQAIISRLVAGQPWEDCLGEWHTSVVSLLAAVTLLTFARILQIGGRMRTELDLTV